MINWKKISLSRQGGMFNQLKARIAQIFRVEVKDIVQIVFEENPEVVVEDDTDVLQIQNNESLQVTLVPTNQTEEDTSHPKRRKLETKSNPTDELEK